jgi:SnoaL-like domain
MSDHKAVVTRWFNEVWNQGKRETIDELLSKDCVIHDSDTDAKGPAGFEVFFRRLQSAFSAIHVTPHETVKGGSWRAVLRKRWAARSFA